MVREKRDQPDDDAVERGPSGSGESGAEQENQPEKRTGGESSMASSDPSLDADNVGDTAPASERDNLPIAEPSAETSGIDDRGEVPPEMDRTVQVPPLPPDPLAQSSTISSSLFAPPAESGGIPFVDLSPDASGAGDELSMQDLVERANGSATSDLGQAVLDATATGPPAASVPDSRVDSPIESQPDSPSTGRISPLFLSLGSGERRVEKRLEIEVEVTVANADRISLIAVDKAKREFKLLASDAVYQVRQDLRTFRESYRDAWGR